jgi:preprotein translocase subunit SecG
MAATLLVIHVLLAIALIGVILVQRSSSDGGGLMGGGGSASLGGLMTVRGTANLLTRVTSALATAFIVTSIVLTILAGSHHTTRSIADQIPVNPPSAPAVPVDGAGQPAPPATSSKPIAPDNKAPASAPAVPLSQ